MSSIVAVRFRFVNYVNEIGQVDDSFQVSIQRAVTKVSARASSLIHVFLFIWKLFPIIKSRK